MSHKLFNDRILGGLYSLWKDLTDMLAADYVRTEPGAGRDVIVTPSMVSFILDG